MAFVTHPTSPIRADHWIAGQVLAAGEVRTLKSPYSGQVIGSVALGTAAEVDKAVDAAKLAASEWRRVPLKERADILLRMRAGILTHLDELANLAALEAGKTIAEARAGLLKGIEVLDFAASLPNMDRGGILEVSRGVTCHVRREALGVVCGITPFNFPAMVPMWMIPIALACGNAFILKPSEKVPLTPFRLAQIFAAAGLPPGVFSIVNGEVPVVEALARHRDLAAVAFVGSTPIAKRVYDLATTSGKRALCLGGAKNHSIVVPDADPEMTIQGILDSFTGCGGQRCMALSLLIAVAEPGSADEKIVDRIVAGLVDRARAIPLGSGMGAIIDKAARDRIVAAIGQAEKDGAKILLDGRKATPPAGWEGGQWLGPTIIDRALPNMECAREEIFGPVLTIIRKSTLGEAVCLENGSPFGNACSVFTTNGAVARYVEEHATAGMIGINIGVPVPREPFSFGGTKTSKFGAGDITGDSAVAFWTQLKKVTTKWSNQKDRSWMS